MRGQWILALVGGLALAGGVLTWRRMRGADALRVSSHGAPRDAALEPPPDERGDAPAAGRQAAEEDGTASSARLPSLPAVEDGPPQTWLIVRVASVESGAPIAGALLVLQPPADLGHERDLRRATEPSAPARAGPDGEGALSIGATRAVLTGPGGQAARDPARSRGRLFVEPTSQVRLREVSLGSAPSRPASGAARLAS
jgi:hypothetical protein